MYILVRKFMIYNVIYNIKYINKNVVNLISIIAAYNLQEYIFAKIHIVQFHI